VTGVIGGLIAASVNGSITVQGCRDGTDVSSVSGDIRLSGVQGMVRATCISGNITIDEVVSRDVRVSNTGGDIVYTGSVEPDGRYTLGSHPGAIMFTLLGEHGIVANLSTFSGDIITPLDLTLTGPRTSRRALAGLLGDGSATVTITAFSGDITLRKR